MTVRDWVIQRQAILAECLDTPIRGTDFTDDRLSQVLTHLSHHPYWQEIENRLWQNEVSVYRLKPDAVRLDATVANGYHTVTEESLMQYGYNPNNNQPQIKVMAASADIGTNGHLVATEVVSGQNADAPLYSPILERVRQTMQESGLLYMGDSKMSALATRSDIVAHGDFYLIPLAKVGEVPQLLDACLDKIVDGDQTATLIFDETSGTDSPRLIAAGYETTRSQSHTGSFGGSITWEERLLVIRSASDAKRQQMLLDKRLKEATEELLALTPPVGRGRRQIRSETQLIKRAEAIQQRLEVKAFLHYTFQREENMKTQYVGRGRGGGNRPQRTTTTVRYQITQVQRDENAITAAKSRMGWRLYATNQQSGLFPIENAIRLYRQAPRMERHFHLFKGAPVGLSPLYVRRDDPIKGLVRLLSLCVRLLTLIEIVARRALAQRGEKLSGLIEGNPKQQTDQPTAIRLLKAFRQISCVQMKVAGQCLGYLTPLSPLQRQILSLLELSETIYEVPVQNSG